MTAVAGGSPRGAGEKGREAPVLHWRSRFDWRAAEARLKDYEAKLAEAV